MLTKTMPLYEVATIITGISEDRNVTSGTYYRCFQPNSFNELGEVEALPTILRKEPVREQQLVRVGDVLVKRLNHNYPYLVKDIAEHTVVSPNLFIVRPKPALNPAYLAFLFEQPGIISQIAAHLSGTDSTIKAISTKTLMEITVQLIPVDKQELLGNLWLFNKRRKMLLKEYMAESDRLLQAVAERCVK